MGNPFRGAIDIEADGQRYTLTLDFNTFVEIEEATGLDMQALGPALSDSPSAKLVQTVFWATLLDQHPDVTPRDAGRLISAIGLDGFGDAFNRLFAAVMPKADTARPPKARKPAATLPGGTGSA
ncbi:hypothetical protein ABC347_07770 [Sphingomonas sp. 1P06PA]|uniref:hypothetical protein n=1 Tax=Sphingomonas sp. 1P06PA TaxID=554121 RepID=UPI0039A65998